MRNVVMVNVVEIFSSFCLFMRKSILYPCFVLYYIIMKNFCWSIVYENMLPFSVIYFYIFIILIALDDTPFFLKPYTISNIRLNIELIEYMCAKILFACNISTTFFRLKNGRTGYWWVKRTRRREVGRSVILNGIIQYHNIMTFDRIEFNYKFKGNIERSLKVKWIFLLLKLSNA